MDKLLVVSNVWYVWNGSAGMFGTAHSRHVVTTVAGELEIAELEILSQDLVR